MLRRGDGATSETIHTGRLWHALHVGLTGVVEGGPEPACWVVWGGPGVVATMSSVDLVHPPERVAEIAAWLATRSFADVLADVRAAIELGEYVYDHRPSDDSEFAARLSQVFARVCAFYDAAASAGQSVEITRA